MTLDDWRALNYIFQDLIITQLFLVTGYAFFMKKTISKNTSPIVYYLLGSALFEIISKIVFKINENAVYLSYTNFLFIILENIMLYWFIFLTFPNNKKVRFFIISNVAIILGSFVYWLIKDPNPQTKVSLVPAIMNFVFLGYFLYLLNIKFSGKSFLRIPEIIICLSFFISYLVLIILFFLKPFLIEYSRILANQVIILGHIISIIFYLLIGYALSLKKTKY